MKNFVFALSILCSGFAQANLIDKNITFQCPECAPALTQTFQAKQGASELSPWQQFTVDVENNSLQITWLGQYTTINPGHFIFSWDKSDYSISNAWMDSLSTMPYSFAFTSNSVDIDFGGVPTQVGDVFKVNLTAVPEPALLNLFAVGLLVAYAAKRKNK